MQAPNVVFKTRVRDESVEGPNPFRWQDVTTDDIFKGKKVIVLFALPGAFTPTCSSTHAAALSTRTVTTNSKALGVDEIYLPQSVNDAFVMFQWGKHLGLENVQACCRTGQR